MRKAASIFIVFMLIVSSIQTISSDELMRIYSDINVFKAQSIDIPIKIKNNKGLMGYKFTVKAKNLSISDVVQGETFADGMFNYRIGEKKDSAEIIWTNNTETKTDGELFTVKADITDSKKHCQLNIIYSPSDTIDGNYNEVSLACDLIEISPDNEGIQSTTTNTSYDNQEQENLILEYINGVESDDAKQAAVKSLVEAGVKIDAARKYTTEEIKKHIEGLSEEKRTDFIKQFNIEISKRNNSLSAVPEKDGITTLQ